MGVCVCVCTVSLFKAGFLTVFQVEETIVISFTAAVDKRPAGSALRVEVPAESVSSTASLLHGQLAQVGWSCRQIKHTRLRTENKGSTDTENRTSFKYTVKYEYQYQPGDRILLSVRLLHYTRSSACHS